VLEFGAVKQCIVSRTKSGIIKIRRQANISISWPRKGNIGVYMQNIYMEWIEGYVVLGRLLYLIHILEELRQRSPSPGREEGSPEESLNRISKLVTMSYSYVCPNSPFIITLPFHSNLEQSLI
jgi:hypothetical protein